MKTGRCFFYTAILLCLSVLSGCRSTADADSSGNMDSGLKQIPAVLPDNVKINHINEKAQNRAIEHFKNGNCDVKCEGNRYQEQSENLLFSEIANTELIQVLKDRLFYIRKYCDTKSLIRQLDSALYVLKLENTSSDVNYQQDPSIFLSWKDIRADLGFHKNMSVREKAERIQNVVDKYHNHTSPIYTTSELHSPFYFFTVYGTGFCDDAAQNTTLLAKHFDLKAKVVHLNGHVVSTIFHDEDWRIYDPDALRIVEVGGNTATLKQMEVLGKKEKLEGYNEIYATADNNSVSEANPRYADPPEETYIEMFPFERRYYFSDFWQISHSGGYLEKFSCPKSLVRRAHGIVANYVRKIPVSSLDDDATIMIKDFFPFAGVLISIPKGEQPPKPGELPRIFMDSSKTGDEEIYIPGLELITSSEDYYYDLTPGIKNLEEFPSGSIILSNMDKIRNIPGAELITIHYYCYANAKFSQAGQLATNGLQVKMEKN